jgi:peptidoglycan-associated lipoprotein
MQSIKPRGSLMSVAVLSQPRSMRGLRFALVTFLALSVAACASKKDGEDGAGGFGSGGFGAGGVAAPGSVQDFTVNVGDRVLFETDSTELTAEARSILDKQVQWLRQYGRYNVSVEGHADERGTREYNIALGARRAQTVRDYLAARGLDSSRIKTTSYGKERPVSVCNDISCWSQNRRAVTVPQ